MEGNIAAEKKAAKILEMPQRKYRHERKHIINHGDYIILRNRLRMIMKHDSNVGIDGTYRIRSLYFDNIDDKVLREKINGYDKREKFRIRYYNQDYSYIRLEKKSKIHGLCGKESVQLTKEQCEQILAGDIQWMLESDEALLVDFYTKMQYQQLKPRVLVDYIREPFMYKPGNVRVTLDSEIRTGLYNNNLFDEESLSVIVPDNQIVLEVKYDEFIPEIIENMVQLGDRRESGYSKYAASRMYG